MLRAELQTLFELSNVDTLSNYEVGSAVSRVIVNCFLWRQSFNTRSFITEQKMPPFRSDVAQMWELDKVHHSSQAEISDEAPRTRWPGRTPTHTTTIAWITKALAVPSWSATPPYSEHSAALCRSSTGNIQLSNHKFIRTWDTCKNFSN